MGARFVGGFANPPTPPNFLNKGLGSHKWGRFCLVLCFGGNISAVCTQTAVAPDIFQGRPRLRAWSSVINEKRITNALSPATAEALPWGEPSPLTNLTLKKQAIDLHKTKGSLV